MVCFFEGISSISSGIVIWNKKPKAWGNAKENDLVAARWLVRSQWQHVRLSSRLSLSLGIAQMHSIEQNGLRADKLFFFALFRSVFLSSSTHLHIFFLSSILSVYITRKKKKSTERKKTIHTGTCSTFILMQYKSRPSRRPQINHHDGDDLISMTRLDWIHR